MNSTFISAKGYRNAVLLAADRWIPACGGMEVPFTHNGTRWLYVFNPRLVKHAYLNLDTDIIDESPDLFAR